MAEEAWINKLNSKVIKEYDLLPFLEASVELRRLKRRLKHGRLKENEVV